MHGTRFDSSPTERSNAHGNGSSHHTDLDKKLCKSSRFWSLFTTNLMLMKNYDKNKL